MFTCIVIDNEQLSRQHVSEMVERNKRWSVIAEAANYQEAEKLIQKHRPDFFFTAINPIDNGSVELASKISRYLPSAWILDSPLLEDDLRALSIEIPLSLPKPAHQGPMQDVMTQAEGRISKPFWLKKNILAVKSIGEVQFINIDEIVWIKGAGNYVELHCRNRMLLHRETLATLEQQLDPEKFVRVHRCAIVSLENIIALTSELGRHSLLKMNNNDEVKIGRAYKSSLFFQLGLEKA